MQKSNTVLILRGFVVLGVILMHTSWFFSSGGSENMVALSSMLLEVLSLFAVPLFMAIALHKLPEGMAAGVSVCSAEGATEWGVSFGIALQNIPEGMVIIAPLMMAGVTAVRTFFISIFIALLEVAGILLGFGLGSASSTFLPVMLGFAGGAMLYVTSDEMIPETHAHGFQKQATYALLLGFITFVLMEKCV